MTLNKMMIIGNLGADPELRYTPSGKAVAELRVAVNDRSRGPDGEWQEETQWFRVELWEQAAERAAERLRKGHKVFAEGQLRAREWEGKDGQKRTSLEIRFARIQSLERRDPGEGGYSGGGFNDAGSGPADAPVARPRGAGGDGGSGGSGGSPASSDSLDVDDIPF
jgi:single-strand DNA-binding protein